MGGRKAIDRTGQKYGHLLVIKQVKDPTGKAKSAYWECTCDCEKIILVQANNLRSGSVKSCGCAKLENKEHWNRKIGKSYTNDGNFLLLYDNYIRNANNSKREFSLDYKKFKELVTSNCYYCGSPPSGIFKNRSRNSKSTPCVYNGIDRKDNSIGYVESNCLPCCKICNRAKHAGSFEDFLIWLDRVAQFQKKPATPEI